MITELIQTTVIKDAVTRALIPAPREEVSITSKMVMPVVMQNFPFGIYFEVTL